MIIYLLQNTPPVSVAREGTVVLFRDYAIHDMAMIRFAPGAKIGERFYVRQDGTRYDNSAQV